MDFSWSELLVIALVALFVFGPQDIPRLMYHFGRIVRRVRYLRYALSSQFEDFMQKAEQGAKPSATPKTAVSEAGSETQILAPEPSTPMPARRRLGTEPLESDEEWDDDLAYLEAAAAHLTADTPAKATDPLADAAKPL